ncbi:MAG: cbb3-type cytochrome c oxidase subunit I [Planctomycetota bacterium]
MTTTTTTVAHATPHQSRPDQNYLNHSRGFMSWFFTLDHKRIGIMYLVSIMTFFAVGGFFAVALRTELLSSNVLTDAAGNVLRDEALQPMRRDGLISPQTYNQFFTLHGAIMVFLVIIPSIPAALGNFVLPMMLGAKDVAFPRLNLFSFHLYLLGAFMFILTLINGGLDTGWTFYTPYSTTTTTSVVSAVMGAFILGFSSIFTGLNFLVTIHKMRPPGMGYFRMPLFLWGMYATAVIQVLATPVLGITLLMLAVERMTGLGIFDPARGGDPVLFQHFFWFYSHPAVYIMILPGMAVISELISAFSRKHIFGYSFIAISSIAIALFGFFVWGHHMFTSGQSTAMSTIFSAITFSIAIPSAIKMFNWMTTMYKGSIVLKTPMIWALGFMWLFGIGGLTGLPLATMATDVYYHDTYFVVAHFHFVMVGGTLWALFGGLYYWWPKITGKMYEEKLGIWASLVSLVGFNVLFFPQFFLGNMGMPRRYYDYLPEFQTWHRISTIGAYILTVGLGMVAYNLLRSLTSGKKAPANPWGANTLEWHTPSPPPFTNFDYDPVADDPYDMERWKWDPETEQYLHVPASPEAAARAH